MKHLIISPRARREIERIDSRWVKNRPAAPDLFYSELREIIDLLRQQPYLGHKYPPKSRRPQDSSPCITISRIL